MKFAFDSEQSFLEWPEHFGWPEDDYEWLDYYENWIEGKPRLWMDIIAYLAWSERTAKGAMREFHLTENEYKIACIEAHTSACLFGRMEKEKKRQREKYRRYMDAQKDNPEFLLRRRAADKKRRSQPLRILKHREYQRVYAEKHKVEIQARRRESIARTSRERRWSIERALTVGS